MLSLDLRQILPPKMQFFVRQNCKFRLKKFVTNPEVRQFRQISSKINIFVTTASFRHFVSFSSAKSFGA